MQPALSTPVASAAASPSTIPSAQELKQRYFSQQQRQRQQQSDSSSSSIAAASTSAATVGDISFYDDFLDKIQGCPAWPEDKEAVSSSALQRRCVHVSDARPLFYLTYYLLLDRIARRPII